MSDDVNNAMAFEIGDAPWVVSPEHRVIYANQTKLGITTSDFQLTLAITSTTGNVIKNVELATVYFSPEQAKALSMILSKAVESWEQTHKVTLPLPPHLQAQLSGIAPPVAKRKLKVTKP